jgi:hypothetical protein
MEEKINKSRQPFLKQEILFASTLLSNVLRTGQ